MKCVDVLRKSKIQFLSEHFEKQFQELEKHVSTLFFILVQEVVGQVHEVFVTFMKKPSYQVFIKMIF